MVPGLVGVFEFNGGRFEVEGAVPLDLLLVVSEGWLKEIGAVGPRHSPAMAAASSAGEGFQFLLFWTPC